MVIMTMYNIMSNQKNFIFVISVVLLFRGSDAFSSEGWAEFEKQERIMIENDLKLISQGQETNALVGWLVQERMNIARLNQEIGRLKEQKEQAQKEELKKLYRQTIEEVEDGFPQQYDDDFDSKKVVWDKTKLKAKTGYDVKEERRRQQWLHYLKTPPNDQMGKIVAHAANLSIGVEKLAEGISKAHRFLSDDCHVRPIGSNVRIRDPNGTFMKGSVVLSLRIVLKEADILQDFIDAMEF